MYDKMAKRYNEIFPLNENALEFIRNTIKEGNIIDMGCGTGSMANALYSKGFNVKGIDLEENMIKIAKETYNENQKLEYIVGDISKKEVFSKMKYNGIISLGNTIPHLEKENLIEFFSNCNRHLETEGTFIIQTLDYKYILEERISALPIIKRNGFEFKRNYLFIKDKILFETQLIEKNKIVYKGSVELIPYTIQKIKEYLNSTGFQVKEYFSDYKTKRYSYGKLPLIIVAKKKN